MPLGDVFFDYDMSTIREDARPILQKNADYLRRWASTRVSLEGHTDSRGTTEYQLGARCAPSWCSARLPRESRDRARSSSGRQQR